jgi:hypothetical protein
MSQGMGMDSTGLWENWRMGCCYRNNTILGDYQIYCPSMCPAFYRRLVAGWVSDVLVVALLAAVLQSFTGKRPMPACGTPLKQMHSCDRWLLGCRSLLRTLHVAQQAVLHRHPLPQPPVLPGSWGPPQAMEAQLLAGSRKRRGMRTMLLLP